jgi:GH25 family lysozyme M1 (1,4-beta-N-acetylmuramidase)
VRGRRPKISAANQEWLLWQYSHTEVLKGVKRFEKWAVMLNVSRATVSRCINGKLKYSRQNLKEKKSD